MRKRRPEAILDVYNLVLGAALFVSPWLFAFSQGAASIDARLAPPSPCLTFGKGGCALSD
jgi:hypothetical protein